MQSVLPEGRLPVVKINPKISIFYGAPKIGKTTLAAMLGNSLLLDFEKGAEGISATRVPISSIAGGTSFNPDGTVAYTSLNKVYDDIIAWAVAEYTKTGKKPPPPYTFIIFDTIDKCEEYCEVTATDKYKNSTIGKNFDGSSVIELPKGAGYYHLRNEVMEQINRFANICDHLILLSHLKEKLLDKGGVDVTVQDISLTGKLGSMVCAKADCIGYIYREGMSQQTAMVNFQTFDAGSVMGARFKRLAGQKMPFDWKKIFIPDGKAIGPDGPEVTELQLH